MEINRLKSEHEYNLNKANKTIKHYEEEIKKLKEECNQAIQLKQSEGDTTSMKNDLLKER